MIRSKRTLVTGILASLALVLMIGFQNCEKPKDPNACQGVNLPTAYSALDEIQVPLGLDSSTEDDPRLLKDLCGRIHLVFLSNQGSVTRIFKTHTDDGINWSTPTAITNDSQYSDMGPSLFQDSKGVFHLAWFRAPPAGGLQWGNIWYSSSPDGISWDPRKEVQVTFGSNLVDLLPTIIKNHLGELFVYFSRVLYNQPDQLFVSKSSDEGKTWSQPVSLDSINTAPEATVLGVLQNIAYPKVIQGSNLTYHLAYTQCPPPYNILPTCMKAATSNVFAAQSSDGMNWTNIRNVSRAGANILPSFFYEHGTGNLSLTWGSNVYGNIFGDAVRYSLSGIYPDDMRKISQSQSPHNPSIPYANFAPQVVPLKSGKYLALWVRIIDPQQNNQSKLFYRIY